MAGNTEITLPTALHTILGVMEKLVPNDQLQLLDAVNGLYKNGAHRNGNGADASVSRRSAVEISDSSATPPPFSSSAPSPKEFMLKKQPQKDVERIVCLGYYLQYHCDMEHFKTSDLSNLNAEAAQPKISNASNAANNAVRGNYLVSTVKGNRKLSAAAEQFVEALPDREAAMAAMNSLTKTRRRNKTRKKTKSTKSAM